MSEDKRRLARGIERELVNEYPAFANVPQAERERLADYWAEDSYVDEFGVLRDITGTALKDSLRFALEQKAGVADDATAQHTATGGLSETEQRVKYDGLTKADYDAKPPHERHAIDEKVRGKPAVVESWRTKVGPVPTPGGVKLTPEEKIAYANQKTFEKMGVIKND